MWYFIFAIILTVVAAIVNVVGTEKDKDWNIWVFILGMIAGYRDFLKKNPDFSENEYD